MVVVMMAQMKSRFPPQPPQLTLLTLDFDGYYFSLSIWHLLFCVALWHVHIHFPPKFLSFRKTGLAHGLSI